MIKYRQLGRTSLQISTVGFGASPLGDVFDPTDPVEAVKAIRLAIDHGINFFDVSPYYGRTLAETRLGEGLDGYRDRVVLATKCGRIGKNEFDFSGPGITAGFEQSLRRMRTDYVDLLQAHDVEFAQVDQIVEETIPAMRELQKQGKARYIGITGYSLRNLMDIAARSDVDSMLSYCRYNLMIGDLEDELIPFAKQHGIGVINASALHMGVLTKCGAPSWHPASAEIRSVGKKIMDLCEQRGIDGSEVALRYCFDNHSVASTLVGMSTRQHVEACLKALKIPNNLSILEEIRELTRPVYNHVWLSGREENYG